MPTEMPEDPFLNPEPNAGIITCWRCGGPDLLTQDPMAPPGDKIKVCVSCVPERRQVAETYRVWGVQLPLRVREPQDH